MFVNDHKQHSNINYMQFLESAESGAMQSCDG